MNTNTEKITLATGKHLNFVRRGKWEYVERPSITGIVAIVALTAERKLLLVEQVRPPLQKAVIELPAGLAGDVAGSESEALETAAARELLEETGYSAERFTYLAEGAASAGLTDEVITLFRAEGLKKTGPGEGDGGEEITLHEVPIQDVRAWLEQKRKAGAVIDLKVYAGLYFIQ